MEGEFEGHFGALCTREKIKQEVKNANTPEQNVVAKLQIAIIEAAGLAAIIM